MQVLSHAAVPVSWAEFYASFCESDDKLAARNIVETWLAGEHHMLKQVTERLVPISTEGKRQSVGKLTSQEPQAYKGKPQVSPKASSRRIIGTPRSGHLESMV